MKKLQKASICAVMLFMISTSTIAAELNNGQDIAQEALSVANQYQSIAKTIETKGATITALGEAHSAVNISLVEKVKAIMYAIQMESENLVNLVMHGNTTNTTSPEKLTPIISHLEAERSSLSAIIAPQIESSLLTLNPDDKKEIKTAFQVYQ